MNSYNKVSFLSGQQVTNPPIDPIREKIVMSLVRGQLCYLRSFLDLSTFLFFVTGSLILLFVFVLQGMSCWARTESS